MKNRTIEISLEKARDMYKTGNPLLMELALSAFEEKELQSISKEEVFEGVLKDLASAKVTILKDEIERLGAYNTLITFANFFNKGSWHKEPSERGYFVNVIKNCAGEIKLEVRFHESVTYPGIVYFKKKEDLEETMKLLGKELFIKLL